MTLIVLLSSLPDRATRLWWGGRPLTVSECPSGGVDQPLEETSLKQASMIGLDIAKRVFLSYCQVVGTHLEPRLPSLTQRRPGSNSGLASLEQCRQLAVCVGLASLIETWQHSGNFDCR